MYGSHSFIALHNLHLLQQKILRKCIWFTSIKAHRIDSRPNIETYQSFDTSCKKSTPASPIVL